MRVRFDEKSGGANRTDHYFIDDVRLTTGGGARVLEDFQPLADDDPQIEITDPSANAFTVPNAVSTLALFGSCNAFATGLLTWSNDLGGSGFIPASAEWTVPSIPLSIGDNVISISATNAAGAMSTASVTITRRADSESTDAAVLAAQGFEEFSDDTWSYALGANAAPTSERARTWFHSLVLAGSAAQNIDPTVEFENIDLSQYDNAQVIVAFAAQGPDSGDNLWLDLSYDNGATWKEEDSVRLVGGFRNGNLAFDSTSSMSVGANPTTLEIPSGAEQAKVRIRFDEGAETDNTTDFFFIDDIRIVAEEIAGDDDDNDGLEDTWEASFFKSIVSAPGDNPDGDALSNWEEFILDRNPNDSANPDTRFAVEGIGPDSLLFPASTRRCYTLQVIDDPTATPQVWTDVPSVLNRRGTNSTMSLPLENGPGSRIYRVKVTLP